MPLALDADPRHLAPLLAELRADDGNVVLGRAGDHARAAPGAGVEIDGHAPAVVGMIVWWIERNRFRRLVVADIDAFRADDLRRCRYAIARGRRTPLQDEGALPAAHARDRGTVDAPYRTRHVAGGQQCDCV